MHAHHFLRLERPHSPVVCGQRYETNSRTYAKTLKKLKQSVSLGGKKVVVFSM